LHGGWISPLVIGMGDMADGFVEDQGEATSLSSGCTRGKTDRLMPQRARPQFGDRLTIEQDQSLGDVFIRLATRTQPSLGQ
jgi:hypothetical protein